MTTDPTTQTQDTAQDATQAPQDAPETPQATAPTTEPTQAAETQDDDGAEHPAREAAKYRRRLRETETERDQLRERIESLQRAEIERHASHLTQPSAIWAAGITVADVLNEAGDVDPERVTEAITAAAEQLGLARRPSGPYAPREGGNGLPIRRADMAEVIRG